MSQQLTAEQSAFFAKYGRMPPAKKDLLKKQLNGADRKYFDSGDYAMSQVCFHQVYCQAGRASERDIGQDHPTPENIPHSSLIIKI